jgi:hypothetical protein
MNIVVMKDPNGRVGTYECQVLPRVGDTLDLTGARPNGPHLVEFETEDMTVLQVIHQLGPEADCHRVTLRVVPLRTVTPGTVCPWFPG